MNTLVYEFSEVPLLIDDGIEAGLMDGKASIAFDEEGEWYVDGITLDAYQSGKGALGKTSMDLNEHEPEHAWLYHVIELRLTNEKDGWFDNISEAVRLQLAEDGISIIPQAEIDYREHAGSAL